MTFNVGDKIRRTGDSSYYLRQGETYVVAGYLKRDKPFVDGVRIDGVDGVYYDVTGFELVKPTKSHKWAKEIKAWADGAKIQSRHRVHNRWSEWKESASPAWTTHEHFEYRIYQEPKPDYSVPLRLGCLEGGGFALFETGADNFKATFDGETGKLKAVELIK